MNATLLKRLFGKRSVRRFSAWQIELTTRCPLKCRMCMRDAVDHWNLRDMNIDDFRKLVPYFKDVRSVVLEGWGEPLLYRDLVDAVRMVKSEGTRAGFVTSGWGLTRDYAAELIEAGLDFIGFSLSGATPQTHESIRVNSSLEKVLTAMRELHRLKTERKTRKPKVHIVYLMVKDNLPEIVDLPRLAASVGVEEVFLINLVQVCNEWQESRKAFSCDAGEPDESFLEEAGVEARKLGVRLAGSPLSPSVIAVCDEDPLRNVYISADGEVSPCVHLYPPTPSPFTRIFRGRPCKVDKVSFGNIFRGPFEEIWNGSGYRAFRECLTRRREKLREIYAPTGWSPKRLRALREEPIPPPPGPCRTCHKMLGF